MRNIQSRVLASFISLVLIFVFIFHTSNSARAWWGIADVSFDPADIVENALSYAEEIMMYEEEYGNNLKEWAKRAAINAIKKAAVNAIQKNLKKSSSSKMITDYGKYLYTETGAKTDKQMDTFYTSISGGTNSSMNYEGVSGGSSYGNYLALQAEDSVNGVNISVNITDVVSNPKEPFSSGNMQGFISILECTNNPYCVSIAAQVKKNKLQEQNQKVAELEQKNGFKSTKENGEITAPASSSENQYLSVAKMAIDTVVNAANNDDSSEGLIDSALSMLTEVTDESGSDSTDSSSFSYDEYDSGGDSSYSD